MSHRCHPSAYLRVLGNPATGQLGFCHALSSPFRCRAGLSVASLASPSVTVWEGWKAERGPLQAVVPTALGWSPVQSGHPMPIELTAFDCGYPPFDAIVPCFLGFPASSPDFPPQNLETFRTSQDLWCPPLSPIHDRIHVKMMLAMLDMLTCLSREVGVGRMSATLQKAALCKIANGHQTR